MDEKINFSVHHRVELRFFSARTSTQIGKNSYAHIIPSERAIDIDTRLDLEIARVMITKNLT